jgi:hypothetical protein
MYPCSQFEGNRVADCTFDTIDSGGFYTCGQRGAAFTNRGNVLQGNTFERIRNTAGLGVQVESPRGWGLGGVFRGSGAGG